MSVRCVTMVTVCYRDDCVTVCDQKKGLLDELSRVERRPVVDEEL